MFCARRENLRRTVRIALVVGVLLTVINQSGVIAAGDATTVTWVRCGLNFVVPFLVSNAGLLQRPPVIPSGPSGRATPPAAQHAESFERRGGSDPAR